MNTWLFHQFLKVQAIALLVLGQKRAALARFEAMRRLLPLNAYVMASRAHLLGELGDKHGSVEALTELTQVQSDSSAPWFNLGYMLDDIGCHAEAEPAFRRAIELEPKMDRAWYGLALVLGFVGAKMLLTEFVHIPVGLSVAVILTTVGGSMAYSVWKTRAGCVPCQTVEPQTDSL